MTALLLAPNHMFVDDMSVDIALLGCSEGAVRTGEGFLPRVNTDMSAQESRGHKQLAAQATGVFPRRSARKQLPVRPVPNRLLTRLRRVLLGSIGRIPIAPRLPTSLKGKERVRHHSIDYGYAWVGSSSLSRPTYN